MQRLEGAVILGCLEENCEPLARRTGFPIVFIDSGRGNYDNIGLQDYEGGYEVASYMLKQGNDKIAFFCDQRDPVGPDGERYRGFLDAGEKYGASFSKEEIIFFLPADKHLRHEVLRPFRQKPRKLKAIQELFSYMIFWPTRGSISSFPRD